MFAGSILLASAFMYLRITILVGIFNWKLLHLLAGPFLTLAVAAAVTGFLWSRRPNGPHEKLQREYKHDNPLELRSAFLFAGLFLVILILTKLAFSYMGNRGAYILGAVLGFADVDPFILSMTQSRRGNDFACCKRRSDTSSRRQQ